LEEGKMKKLLAASMLLAATVTVSCAQDVEAGERSFRKCSACHRVGEDARNLIGPKLNGLDGGKSGAVEGYDYTAVNKNAGIVWSEATFREYIQNPAAKMPGTKMFFPGIKDENEISDLWAYLKRFGPDGKIR
jgi:cytochrome c